MVSYLDYAGLSYLWTKLKATFVTKENGKGLSANDFSDAYKSMLDSVDSSVTENSENLVTSGAVATALAGKQASLTFDDSPTSGSNNPVKSGGIYTALEGKKNIQTAVADPAADGNSIEFISGITQNTQGVISPEKKTIRSASTTQTGVIQLSSATDSTAENLAATPKAVKTAKDAADNAQTTANNAIPSAQKGVANGVAPLDNSGKIDSQYLPSYVDDVIEVYPVAGKTALASDWFAIGSASGSAVNPEAGKIYVLMSDVSHTEGSGASAVTVVDYAANTQFRWGGTGYVKLNDGGVTAITSAEIDTILAS